MFKALIKTILKIFRNKVFVKILLWVVYGIFVIVLIPYFITVFFFGGENTSIGKSFIDNSYVRDIYSGGFEEKENSKNSQIIKENPQMESYIIGVVAAEMPVSFHTEALKAQAVAARTYAYRQVGDGEIKPENIGQAFIDNDEMKKRWGEAFSDNFKKISKAVGDTKNEIMVYGGEPIFAAFHSTSGGMTETSENVWSEKLDYLKSVYSGEDEKAPGFLTRKEFTKEEFKRMFSEKGSVFTNDITNDISDIKRTSAGYVSQIKIGGKVFKGTEVRSILSLRSANFEISFEKDKVVFITKGYGHGAGMSQYGANFMAESGADYKKILSHYYNGVEFISIKG